MSRIIAGSRRGHRLATPAGDRTRPTTDRVREAAFSALSSWLGVGDRTPAESLVGVAFADCYAGSGAVGLEAASRGAAPVRLIERDRATAALATQNARKLGLAVEVSAAAVASMLAGPAPHPYDVMWFDPPYEAPGEQLVEDLRLAMANGWLAADGLVILERSTRTPEPNWPGELTKRWLRRYGETSLYFATRGDR